MNPISETARPGRRRKACAFLFAAVLLPAAASAQVTFVNLYESAAFSGVVLPIPIVLPTSNSIQSLGSFGDRTTSLSWTNLPANVAVEFYENTDGSGARWSIPFDAPRTGSVVTVGPTYNDTFSSYSWHYEVPSQGLLRMWDGASFAGNNRRYALSSYAENSLHVLNGFSDTATSIAWSDLPSNVVV